MEKICIFKVNMNELQTKPDEKMKTLKAYNNQAPRFYGKKRCTRFFEKKEK